MTFMPSLLCSSVWLDDCRSDPTATPVEPQDRVSVVCNGYERNNGYIRADNPENLPILLEVPQWILRYYKNLISHSTDPQATWPVGSNGRVYIPKPLSIHIVLPHTILRLAWFQEVRVMHARSPHHKFTINTRTHRAE
ncbi:hypothetical protein DM02DRAFT_281457 [Periconia macrospinosa]|uniref:Uncharacterized protein n=1 Tax=Periconia macrospinosa TaxID=97972 RepID=A0A2V1D2X7_9PLEO|nr:hypothetical protein DM02DRAFT_281457 [Periconia macrospinosa]